MVNQVFRQFWLLLWKNFQLRRRRPLLFASEVLTPILIVTLLAAVRTREIRHQQKICRFQSKPLPSMGTFVWLQSFLCNFNNSCHNSVPPEVSDIFLQSNISRSFWDVVEAATNANISQSFNIFFASLSMVNSSTNTTFMQTMLENLMDNYYFHDFLFKAMSFSEQMPGLLSLFNSSDSGNVEQNVFLTYIKRLCTENSDLYRSFMSKLGNLTSIADVDNETHYRPKHQIHRSKECNKLYTELNKDNNKLILEITEHMLFGRIYYSPNTTLTRAFIQRANATFDGLGKLQSASLKWRSDVSSWLRTTLNSSSEVNALRTIILFCHLHSTLLPEQRILCGRISNWLETDNRNPISPNWVQMVDMLDVFFNFSATYLPCLELDKFTSADSEEDVNKLLEEASYVWAVVLFDDIDDNSISEFDIDHVKVRIRIENSKVYSTLNFKVLDRTWSPGPRRNPLFDMNYFTYGFIHLQEMIGKGIIETITGKNLDYSINMQQMPYPCYTRDKFIEKMSETLPLLLTIGWIFSVSMTVRAIVYEKEKRLKEVMKIMGLSNGVLWLSWLSTSLIISVSTAILITIILSVSNVFIYSSPTLLFFVIFSFIVSLIGQCFLISVFFSQANIAATVTGILYIMCFLPFTIMQVTEQSIAEGALYALCLLSQVSFSFACQYFARYEEKRVGAHWDNLWESPSNYDEFSLAQCIGAFWVDAGIYFLATWYFDAVIPTKYGISKVWYFPFTKEYWVGSESNQNEALTSSFSNSENEFDLFESDPKDHIIGVELKELRKVYKSANTTAVDGINLRFFDGQITSLLGHNGAGKTTILSIISGLLKPNNGTVYVYGRDIRYQLDTIRKDFGICPQYNVLFDDLTVKDHIYFYGLLKGMQKSYINSEITRCIDAVGLTHKLNELSRNLSGGMKRKLSVAMAFVGGSRVVILDEPTAGMDPYARRSIWTLIGKFRKDRTVILTTHHMDEADVLGDRIAIISRGKLRCVGSSEYLRKLIGKGYSLVISKAEDKIIKALMTKRDITNRLVEFVNSFIGGAKLQNETLTEWYFKLPSSGLFDGEFSNLIRNLDISADDLCIKSYGLADSSLEEMFLHISNDPNSDFDISKKSLSNSDRDRQDLSLSVNLKRGRSKSVCKFHMLNSIAPTRLADLNASIAGYHKSKMGVVKKHHTNMSGAGMWTLNGILAYRAQCLAMWAKRLHYFWRNKKGFISQMIVPPVFILVAAGLTSLAPTLHENPPMELHPWLMSPERDPTYLYTFFSNFNSSLEFSSNLSRFASTVLGSSGVRCMNSSLYSIPGYPCDFNINSKWSSIPSINSWSNNADCICTDSCPNSKTAIPSKRLMPSTDFLYNLTGYNITDYLLHSYNIFKRKRFGGFTFRVSENQQMDKAYIHNYRQSLSDNNTFAKDFLKFVETLLTPSKTIDVWFNNKGYISSVAYLSILQNTLLRYQLPNTTGPNRGISFVSHPLNLTYDDIWSQIERSTNMAVLLSICIIIALSFIPASFVIFLVEERLTNSKHLQLLSGLNPTIYWIANYTWDMLNYIVPCILCIIIFLIFGFDAYISPDTSYTFISLMLMYGVAIIPTMYSASFYFQTPSAAFVVVSFVNIICCLATTLSVYILDLLDDNPAFKSINKVLKNVFLIFPQYCLGFGLVRLSMMHIERRYRGTPIVEPHKFDVLGKNILCLGIQAVVMFAVVLLIEHVSCCRCKSKTRRMAGTEGQQDIDEDIKKERERILSGIVNNDALKVERLTKEYYNGNLGQPAVDDLCFGVRRGECFGLLGINGAGKTTTFKILTGDLTATSGVAMIEGQPVGRIANPNLGYCPQFDALHSLLTGRETLVMYARLRGVPATEIEEVVHWALKKLRLDAYADQIVETYSGGNKRKLSIAVALIGDPSVVLLDEPTSGMDAGARRFLWNCINNLVQEGRSVLMTSHSMDECEALCQRLTIMVNGRFKCLGSVQHLKNKFGQGYTLTMKLNNANPNRKKVDEFMFKKLPMCTLTNADYTLLQYNIPLGNILADLLDTLIHLRPLVDRYSISQTSLDQIFIDFARDQVTTELEERRINRLPGSTTKVCHTEQLQSNDLATAIVKSTDLQTDLEIEAPTSPVKQQDLASTSPVNQQNFAISTPVQPFEPTTPVEPVESSMHVHPQSVSTSTPVVQFSHQPMETSSSSFSNICNCN